MMLITGATGFLGPYLCDAFKGLATFAPTGRRTKGSLADEDNAKSLLNMVQPNYIVHAAALTNLNKCQKDPKLAIAVNAMAVANIVNHMPKGCRLIYISTDMVYSGDGPHREFSRSESPLNVYGMSKFMGELEARKADNHLILRTSMYGASRGTIRPSSLADSLIAKFREGKPFHLFSNVYFSPLHVITLSKIIAAVTLKSEVVGTFNVGSIGGMSKAKFVMLLADKLGFSLTNAVPVMVDTNRDSVPRPLDTRLCVERFERTFNIDLPKMEDDMELLRDDTWLG